MSPVHPIFCCWYQRRARCYATDWAAGRVARGRMKCERRIIYALIRSHIGLPQVLRACMRCAKRDRETEIKVALSRRPSEWKRRGGRNKIRVICLSFPGPASKHSSVCAAENECGCGFKDAGAINCTSLARATTPKTALLRLCAVLSSLCALLARGDGESHHPASRRTPWINLNSMLVYFNYQRTQRKSHTFTLVKF